MTLKNQPYVKKYDSMGKITNPIKKSYIHFYPTTAQRKKMQKSQDYRDYLIIKKTNFLKKLTFIKNMSIDEKNKYGVKLIRELKSLYGIFKQALEKSSANKQWI